MVQYTFRNDFFRWKIFFVHIGNEQKRTQRGAKIWILLHKIHSLPFTGLWSASVMSKVVWQKSGFKPFKGSAARGWNSRQTLCTFEVLYLLLGKPRKNAFFQCCTFMDELNERVSFRRHNINRLVTIKPAKPTEKLP